MTIKRIAILVALTTILFVQEELLTPLPNVQLTFLLVFVYGATVGLVDGSIVLLIHVILDNLYMSSFNLIWMIPQFIGLFIALLFGRLLKKRNEFIVSIFGAISALIYCWLYVLETVLITDTKFMDYLIADIPFQVILVASTVISILFLYKPLKKILDDFLLKKERKIDYENRESEDNKSS